MKDASGHSILYCAICMMVKEGEPFQAVTIRGGTAVCEHHWSDASDENSTRLFKTLPVWGGVVKYQTNATFICQECGHPWESHGTRCEVEGCTCFEDPPA